jgi:threonine dehydratase
MDDPSIATTRRPPRAAETSDLVSLDAVVAARNLLAGIATVTPIVPIGRPEARHVLKAESLQPVGSFKIRGAYVAVASLSPEQRTRGAITYSSGNHGRGVARAARLLGVPAIVVVPANATAVKLREIRADGAEVIVAGTANAERQAVAEHLAADRGLALIPPYNDDRVIAGQGTIGLELLDQVPDLAAVLIPIGGGGLASGICVAIRALRPSVRLIGVEPELAADARDSLAAGRIVAWPAEATARTIADGARTQAIGARTFVHLNALLDQIVTVSEAEIIGAMSLAADEAHLVIEPTGGLALAALRWHGREAGIEGLNGTAVAIVSGGNVDPDRYRSWLTEPLPGS